MTQLLGRVWRHPQQKEVIVYHPLLKDSTEMSLTVLSFTKHALMLKFADAGKGLGKDAKHVPNRKLTFH